MKLLAIRMLHALAARVIARYRPIIVGVTGSYGKTTTKEAIAAALAPVYTVRKSPKSFNNEFGVPYTILGVQPGSSGIRTLVSGLRAGLRLLWSRQPYPTILVIEFGDDKPGDLKKLLSLVRLDVGVLTSIGPTHLQHFQTVDNVFAEESQIITTLPDHGWAVLNCDDLRVRSLAEPVMCRIVSYGYSGFVAVRCIDQAISRDERGDWGMLLTMQFQHQEIPVFIPGVVGRHTAYAAMAGFAVGIAFKLDLVEVSQGLRQYEPPAGRMRVLPGVKQTVLIDDTYNSSPDACVAALETLREFPAEGKRYAVLGEMADLGATTEPVHRGMAQPLIDNQIDVLVAVGEKMKLATDEARKRGLPENRIFMFDDPVSAGRFIQERLVPGDVVLLKGSQVSRMEKAVKELMAEPERSGELLVRQDAVWLRS